MAIPAKLSRRRFQGLLAVSPLAVLLLPSGLAADTPAAARLRGKLEMPAEDVAGLRLADGSFVRLHGDPQTDKVLHDERLKGIDLEVHGSRRADGSFEILPIHLPALFTYQAGKRLRVTYYCDVCAIRTYSPGMCMCCREDTRVDLVDPDLITGASAR